MALADPTPVLPSAPTAAPELARAASTMLSSPPASCPGGLPAISSGSSSSPAPLSHFSMRDARAAGCLEMTSLRELSASIHASTSLLKVSTSIESLANAHSASYRTLVDLDSPDECSMDAADIVTLRAPPAWVLIPMPAPSVPGPCGGAPPVSMHAASSKLLRSATPASTEMHSAITAPAAAADSSRYSKRSSAGLTTLRSAAGVACESLPTGASMTPAPSASLISIRALIDPPRHASKLSIKACVSG